jgi:hypothetical protein
MFYVVLVAALLLLLPLQSAVARAPVGSRSSCSTHCSSISIPYPFGVEPGCYHDGGFNLTCDHSYSPPKLYLGDGTVQVLDIYLANGTVRVNSSTYNFFVQPDFMSNINGTWRAGGPGYAADGPYFLAGRGQNNLLAVGCEVQVLLLGENGILDSACTPFCPDDLTTEPDICSGRSCCQATVSNGRASYLLQSRSLSNVSVLSGMFMVESSYPFTVHGYSNSYQAVPAILGWTIRSSVCHDNGSSASCRSKHSFCHNYSSSYDFDQDGPHFDQPVPGHNCECLGGYQGNPYISNGCYGNCALLQLVFLF